jgi:hypothetical protein
MFIFIACVLRFLSCMSKYIVFLSFFFPFCRVKKIMTQKQTLTPTLIKMTSMNLCWKTSWVIIPFSVL